MLFALYWFFIGMLTITPLTTALIPFLQPHLQKQVKKVANKATAKGMIFAEYPFKNSACGMTNKN
jgi:hypothetical protein